jgi:hypothetical protein
MGSGQLAAALDEANAWARGRLTGRQAAALVRDFHRCGGETSWAVAEVAQPRVTRELASVDWSTVAGARLVALVEARFALARGRDEFLPARHAPTAAEGRWLLYLHGLWRAAERRKLAPHAPVLAAIVHALAGPFAWAEVERRLDAHVGTDAATWVLLAGWPAAYGDPAPCDAEVASALGGRLVRAARRHVRPSLRREATPPDVRSAAAQTLLSRLGNVHPLEAVARALDGDLDVLPRAIGNELTRHLTDGLPESRKPSRQRERRIVFDFRDAGELAALAPSSDAADPEAALLARDERERDRTRLRAAYALDPATVDELRRAYADGGGKVDAARALGVSRPTLDARIRRLVDALTNPD